MAQRSHRSSSATAGRAAKLLAGLVAASVGTGVLASGLVLPGVIAAGRATKGTVAAFNSLPAELESQPLSQQSKILYADGSPMATFYYENRVEVPLDAVAPVMQQAIVAIEDARFWEHGGIDPKGMGRAFVNNAAGSGGVQGASTLTQQWIKNVQVEKAVSALPSDATIAQRQAAFREATASSGVDGYARKLREVKLAIAAEKKLSKQQILENYLNITSFGDGQYGIETASEHYFNRPAKDLTLPDAALMAGVVQNPIVLDPVDHPDAALARRNIVLGRMLAQGLIDQGAHDQAVAVPLAQQLQVQPIKNGCAQAGNAAFFCDYVYRSALADPRLGEDRDARRQKLFRGGLTITTTLDRAKQDAADAAVKNTVPADTKEVGAAITTVEPGTGKVLAMAQNRNYTTSAGGSLDLTAINYNVDRDMGGPTFGFQVGSSYKPFTLATWLANGHTLNETIDAPDEASFANIRTAFRSCQRITGPYSVRNSEQGEGGRMSVLAATYESINTAYIEMARQLDLCQIRDTAASVGLRQASIDVESKTTDLKAVPSSVLGVNLISPLRMAAAYAAFAASGTYCAPFAVQSVVDVDGNAILTAAPDCSVRMDPGIADTVTSALSQVLTKGTAAGDGIDWPAAGKTGTTNFQVGQSWFVGYTKQLSTAVWVGTPDTNISLSTLPIKGRKQRVFGGTYAAPTWHDYMQQAMAGQPKVGFPTPPQNLVGASQAPRPTAKSTPRSTRTRTSRPSSSAPPSSAAPAPSSEAPAPAAPPAPPTTGDGGGGNGGGGNGVGDGNGNGVGQG